VVSCRVVWCGACVWCGVVWCGVCVVSCGVVCVAWCSVVWCGLSFISVFYLPLFNSVAKNVFIVRKIIGGEFALPALRPHPQATPMLYSKNKYFCVGLLVKLRKAEIWTFSAFAFPTYKHSCVLTNTDRITI